MDIRDPALALARHRPGDLQRNTIRQKIWLSKSNYRLLALNVAQIHLRMSISAERAKILRSTDSTLVSHLLKINFLATQVQNGAVFCQLVHLLHADAIDMDKVSNRAEVLDF